MALYDLSYNYVVFVYYCYHVHDRVLGSVLDQWPNQPLSDVSIHAHTCIKSEDICTDIIMQ